MIDIVGLDEGKPMSTEHSDSRQKIIDDARTLLRGQGYQGTVLTEIIEVSSAPLGSMSFLFPGGKEEIAVAAVAEASVRIPLLIAKALRHTATPQEWITSVVDHFGHRLETSRFTEGCPIITIARDAMPASEALTAACRIAYDNWLAAIGDGLVEVGVPDEHVPGLATTMLASMEGALILCRAQHSVAALHTTRDHLLALLEFYLVAPTNG
jgi:TetR/AcrR family transcriptional regulator, lmrAB and yxaGH operons repressor